MLKTGKQRRMANLLAGGTSYQRGRVQRQIERAFIANDYKPLRISALLPWCYPAETTYRNWHRTNVHRAVGKVAVRVSKDGKGVMWRP